MSDRLLKLVPRPHADSINTGYSPGRAATLLQLLGEPRAKLGRDCLPVTNTALKKRMGTRNVGPFRVTGLDVALDDLEVIFATVKLKRPDLYDAVGNMGMLCARLVRGSAHIASNHSWGTAIDLTFSGELDLRGDGLVQTGLLEIYPFFKARGWYWGSEFNIEDGMHFEMSNERILAKVKRK